MKPENFKDNKSSFLTLLLVILAAALLVYMVLNLIFRFDLSLSKIPDYSPMPEVEILVQTDILGSHEMVYVPEGVFLMGASQYDDDAYQNELPQHEIYLDAFWIDRIEVTNAAYQKCVEAGACQTPSSFGMQQLGSMTRDSYYQDSEFANYPVIYVSWEDASDYCQWNFKTLPTEAQWEKAARGTDGRMFPWGNEFVSGDLLNFADRNTDFDWSYKRFDDGYADTAPVNSYPEGASPYGAYDMAGNVWEWTLDWYEADTYKEHQSENPSGPTEGRYRVIRGGDWRSSPWGARTTIRSRLDPEQAYSYIGFRCVKGE